MKGHTKSSRMTLPSKAFLTLLLLIVAAVAGFGAGLIYSEVVRNTVREEAQALVREQFDEALREMCGDLHPQPILEQLREAYSP